MYKIPNTIEYNSKNGSWEFTFPKSYKDVHSQGGLKVIIDPSYPTGYNGNLWETKENGLSNPTITVKGYDNVSGWVSYAKFPLPQLLEALIKLVPNTETKTFVLALNDLKLKEEENED